MKNIYLTRAWKDPLYRSTLDERDLSTLQDNPAGIMEVADEDLISIGGGSQTTITTVPLTITITFYTYYAGCLPKTYTRSC